MLSSSYVMNIHPSIMPSKCGHLQSRYRRYKLVFFYRVSTQSQQRDGYAVHAPRDGHARRIADRNGKPQTCLALGRWTGADGRVGSVKGIAIGVDVGRDPIGWDRVGSRPVGSRKGKPPHERTLPHSVPTVRQPRGEPSEPKAVRVHAQEIHSLHAIANQLELRTPLQERLRRGAGRRGTAP